MPQRTKDRAIEAKSLITSVKEHFGWSYDHLVALLSRGKATVMKWERNPDAIDPFDKDMLSALLTVPEPHAKRIGKRVRASELKALGTILTQSAEISADAAFMAGVMFAGLAVEGYATATATAMLDGVKHYQKASAD